MDGAVQGSKPMQIVNGTKLLHRSVEALNDLVDRVKGEVKLPPTMADPTADKKLGAEPSLNTILIETPQVLRKLAEEINKAVEELIKVLFG